MADSFDPYRDWLELNIAEREYPLNHYQILAIDQHASDPEAIQHAADQMLARVRSQRPGDRAADWSRLLDEIETARDCLTNPESRTAYDAQLVSSNLMRVAAPDAANESNSSEQSASLNLDQGAWAPPQLDAVPIDAVPADAEPVEAESAEPDPPSESNPGANPPLPPTASLPTSPVAEPASQPPASSAPPNTSAAFPRAPFDQARSNGGQQSPPAGTGNTTPPTAQPISAAADPMAPVAIPVAAPTAAPATTHPTATPSTSYDPVAMMPPGHQISIDTDDEPARSSLTRTAMFGIVAALLLWGAGMAAFFSGAFDEDAVDKPSVSEKPNPKVGGDPQLPNKPKVDQPKPRPKPKPSPTPQPVPIPTPTPVPNPTPVPPAPTPQPIPTPLPVPLPQPVPPPIPKPQPPTPAQIAKYLGNLSSARAALTRRDFAASQRLLDDARQTRMPSELEMRLEDLQALHDAASDFWRTLGETIANLEGGEEFKISESTMFRVIEVKDDVIVLRLPGESKRYRISELPMGIARRLVAESLGKDNPRTRVVFGATWATAAEADLDKARKYFRQAAAAGADTTALQRSLDDNYRVAE
jgi:hypothetical protein